jgi:MEMO1 family protein
MVPEVGGEAIVDVRSSIDAMAEMTRRVIASGAETVILISPHAPLEPSVFVAYDGPELFGDFSNFRAPAATVRAPLDDALLQEITITASAQKLEVIRIRVDLDHGTAVPLYFLQRNGWQGNLIALGYSFLSNEDHIRFGQCVRQAVDAVGRPVAFIASGDLSHRLQPGAPAGYNSQAHLFDEKVVAAVRNCSISRIAELDQDLRRKAGECGYRSMLVAIGVTQGVPATCEVISYEAPFGVGYMVAQLLMSERHGLAGESTNRVEPAGAELPALARETIETYVTAGRVIALPKNPSQLLQQRAACFVTIKTRAGELRGCIGTIEPAKDTLAEELITNAVNAATRDPRFPPVRDEELTNLKYSVDVLSSPEPACIEDLDPKNYGVIVEEESGPRRGLLLPHLQGIDSVTQQIEIASQKAGIKPGTPLKFLRFRSERYGETSS